MRLVQYASATVAIDSASLYWPLRCARLSFSHRDGYFTPPHHHRSTMRISNLALGSTLLIFASALSGCSDPPPDDPGMGTAGVTGGTGAGGNAGAAGTAAAWDAGNTYLLTVPVNNWATPRNVGGEIGAYVPQFVIAVDSRMGNVANLSLGTASAGMQDMCGPTAAATTAATAVYPQSQIGPINLPMHLIKTNPDTGAQEAIVHATAYNFTLSNALPGDGNAKDGQLDATMDIREIYPMFTQLSADPTPEKVCNALESGFEAPCQACPSDGQVWCLSLQALGLEAALANLTLQPVDPSVVTSDVNCAPTVVTP